MKIDKAIVLIRGFIQWALLVLLILCAIYVTIGRTLIGQISLYEQELTQFLSEMLGAQVTINSISGGWRYLDPELTIAELKLGDPDQPALVITNMSVKLDSMRSLLRFEPTVKELVINGLKLAVIRSEKSGWGIKGMPPNDNTMTVDLVLDLLEHISFLKLDELDLQVFTGDKIYRVDLNGTRHLELSRYAGRQYLSSVIRWQTSVDGDTHHQLHIGGKYQGNPRDPDNFYSDIYLKLPELEISDFLSGRTFNQYQLARMSIGGDYWIKSDDGVISFTGESIVHHFDLIKKDASVSVSSSSSQLVKLTYTDNNWYLALRQLNLQIEGVQLEIPEVDLVWTGPAGQSLLGGQIPALDLSPFLKSMQLIAEKTKFSTKDERKVLDKLAPAGMLEDINFYVELGGARPEFRLVSQLTKAGIKSYKGVPGVTNLDGFVSVGMSGAYLNIHGDHLVLDFAPMFDQPWDFDTAKGKLAFSYEPGNTDVLGDQIELVKDKLHARGKLQINLPRERSEQTWSLVVGIEDGRVEDAGRYLPDTLSPKLKSWLNQSLLSGDLSDAGLLFHGSLAKTAPKINKVYQLYFRVDRTILDYDPGWPRIEEMNGVAYIHNKGVIAGINQGKLFDSQLTRGVVRVPMGVKKPASEIKIDASLSGALTDGLRFLNETPVRETMNHLAQDWVGEGNISTRGLINIPMGKQAQKRKLHTDIRITLADNRLFMPGYNLEAKKLEGVLKYEETRGLSSKRLKAELLGQPVTASISTQLRKKGVKGKNAGLIRLNLLGSVDMKDLYGWSRQPLLLMAEGKFNYRADLEIPYKDGSPPVLRARSRLEGVKVRLPKPFQKAASSKTDFTYEQIFSHPEQRVNIWYGDQVRAGFMTRDGKIVRGAGHVGSDKFPEMPSQGIQIKGNLPYVNYNQWNRALTFLDSRIESSLENEITAKLEFLDIQMGELDAFGINLKNVDSFITRDQQAWKIRLKNEMIDGDILVSDNEGIPVRVNLDYLRFKAEEGDKDHDPLGELDPTAYLNVDFSVNEITYGEENYGTWAFRFRPTIYGAELYDIVAETKGLTVGGGSRLMWKHKDGVHESYFTGLVVAPKLEVALSEWGIASSVEGDDFKMSSDVYWPGSPVMASIDQLKGLIHLRAGKGRFVQAESGGALKMVGILDFASIARRLRLDFSDVVKKGYSYNKIRGVAQLNEGLVTVVEPVKIEGASSTFTLAGSVNLKTNELDNDMIVTLPVSRNLPWYAAYSAIATGPLVGAGVYVVQKLFKKQIDQFSSARYKISGTLDDPVIEFVKIFDDSLRDAPKAAEELTATEANPQLKK